MQVQAETKGVAISLEKPSYLAGDKVQGSVHLGISKPTKIRALDVFLQGIEKVTIDPPVFAPTYVAPSKAHYSSTNEMLNVGLRLLEETTLNPGSRELPFMFDIPPNALPSYVGKYVHVTWRVSVRGDVPWGRDLNHEAYLSIWRGISTASVPLVVENPEQQPKIKVTLPSNLYQPSESIEGKVELLRSGGLRGLRLTPLLREDSMAKGGLTAPRRTQIWNIGQPLDIPIQEQNMGAEIPFKLQLPNIIPCSYTGAYSSVSWFLEATLDVPHGSDIHLYAPIQVGVKRKVTVPSPPVERTPVVQPTSQMSQEAEKIETTPFSVPEIPVNREAEVLQILGDGSAKDLIAISNELQTRGGEFLDVGQVKTLCEELVDSGKLRRAGEGEFFAKYALNSPAGSGPQESSE